jgi:hypothetical protein
MSAAGVCCSGAPAKPRSALAPAFAFVAVAEAWPPPDQQTSTGGGGRTAAIARPAVRQRPTADGAPPQREDTTRRPTIVPSISLSRDSSRPPAATPRASKPDGADCTSPRGARPRATRARRRHLGMADAPSAPPPRAVARVPPRGASRRRRPASRCSIGASRAAAVHETRRDETRQVTRQTKRDEARRDEMRREKR